VSSGVDIHQPNVAPVLSGANNLAAINENPASNPGTPVLSILSGYVTDTNPGDPQGMAVTAVDPTYGTWQYSTNSGGTWTAFGTPSQSAARLLASDSNTYVRFVPNTNWCGTDAGGLTFRAWDQNTGTAGSTADTTSNGGTTSFSIATASANITVNPKTILGTGTDPGNASLAPGGPATMVNVFTFQTCSGTDTISSLPLALSAGSSGGLSLVEITDATGSTVYGSVNNPASDTPTISLSTHITATTTPGTYKIRITPKSHANMPAPPGSTYAVTANVGNWTGSNSHGGSDHGGTTITIDNQSPGNVTAATGTSGDTQATVSWTNPGDADLGSIVVLRRTGNAVTDTPVEGQSYAVGNSIGGSTIACVVSPPGASCTDSGLTNNTTYYYKIFAKDTSGNYSANGVAPAAVTPEHYQPVAMIKLLSEGTGAYLSANVYESTATTQVKSQSGISGAVLSYKVQFQNNGTTSDTLLVTGTGSGSGFIVQYLDDTAADRTAAVTGAGYSIASLPAGQQKVWTLNVSLSGSPPVPGGSVYPVFVTATSAADNSKLDQVKAVTSSISPNITLLKSPDKGSYNPGENVTYTTVASNGAGLANAYAVSVTDPIPAFTGFKVGGASFNAGSSTLTGAISYSNGIWGYTPVSGGCAAPTGYDYCVTQVKWTMTGTMPAGTSFTCFLVVGVK